MYDHMREDEEGKLLTCAHYVPGIISKSELNDHVRKQHMGEGTPAAQPENNNCTHLFSVPLLTPSEREKPDE